MYLGEDMYESYRKAIDYEEFEGGVEGEEEVDSHEGEEAEGPEGPEEIQLEKEDVVVLCKCFLNKQNAKATALVSAVCRLLRSDCRHFPRHVSSRADSTGQGAGEGGSQRST